MITSSELRARARSSLKGNWGRAILLFVLMGLIIGVPDIILSSIDKTVQFAFVYNRNRTHYVRNVSSLPSARWQPSAFCFNAVHRV